MYVEGLGYNHQYHSEVCLRYPLCSPFRRQQKGSAFSSLASPGLVQWSCCTHYMGFHANLTDGKVFGSRIGRWLTNSSKIGSYLGPHIAWLHRGCAKMHESNVPRSSKSPHEPITVQVSQWYIQRPKSRDIGAPLRPRYIPY